jgi:hypothetical protein
MGKEKVQELGTARQQQVQGWKAHQEEKHQEELGRLLLVQG